MKWNEVIKKHNPDVQNQNIPREQTTGRWNVKIW